METKTKTRGHRNKSWAEVISDKMDKTISVLIYRQFKHKNTESLLSKTSVFKAHDEKKLQKLVIK